MAKDQVDELRQVMQRLFRSFGALANDATPCGKPLPMAHAHALMVLLGQAELSQQELSRELNIDKSNVARLCAKMVEAGHAQQKPNERDARSRVVSLTAQGRRLAREVEATSRARFEVLLAKLPRGRRAQLIGGLNELVVAMEVCGHSKEEVSAE